MVLHHLQYFLIYGVECGISYAYVCNYEKPASGVFYEYFSVSFIILDFSFGTGLMQLFANMNAIL